MTEENAKISPQHEVFPLISVIVPVYNTEKYLARCVNSILTQTYSNI
ncbi:MAG: glycosyltransferase [Synergistaceae bacterium]|nr:glycosyltransferase [Synergistaceae bacterium]